MRWDGVESNSRLIIRVRQAEARSQIRIRLEEGSQRCATGSQRDQMDQSGCGVGRLNIITPQEGSTLELHSACVCVCQRVSNFHRPAFTSHAQIFTPVQLPLWKRKLGLGHCECVSHVSACCVYVCMRARTACARICVQEGRAGVLQGPPWRTMALFFHPSV